MKKKTEIDIYIELVYSKDSPLNKIEDLNERKERAAAQAQLDLKDPENQKILDMKNRFTRERIINHLQKTQSNAYMKLMADQQLFVNIQAKLLAPLDDDDDTTKLMQISSQSEELLKRINRMLKKIYIEPELVEEAETKIRVMTPELRLKEKKNATA